MAFVSLTSLITTVELEFLQPTSRLFLHDRAPIKSFVANLSSLQAILQKESSGDGDAVKDLEIQIRDFALETEDHIEIQVCNFLLAEDMENREKASQELLQTLREAAENAAQLLKSITREKESCASGREMASIALTILIIKFEYYFLQPIPMVSLDDEAAAMKSFLENLSSLQACLLQGKSNGGAALKKLETKTRNFAVKTEDDMEIQVSNFLLVKDTEHEEEASKELRQSLREADEIAAKLLKAINKEKEHEREREVTCITFTSLREAIELIMNSLHDIAGIKYDFLEDLSSLQVFVLEESSGGGATTKDLKTKIRNFALKAEYDIQLQLSNFLQDKEIDESQEKASSGLLQAWQEATENATEFLKIITKEKEYHQSARRMASDALNTFMKKIHDDFLHPIPIVLLEDKAAMISFFENLSSLQSLLQKEPSGGAAVNDLETKITDFVLKAEDDIETQIKILIQAKDEVEYQRKASQELHQTVREAAESAAGLLKIIINSKSNDVDEANETQPSNSLVKYGSKLVNVEYDGSSQQFLKLEDRMVGRHHDFSVIQYQLLFPRHELPSLPKIISIVGMVGIGKTTLARNLYEHLSVASHFYVRGWITIPQDYNKNQMLRELLKSITPAEPNVIIKGSTSYELQMQVCNCLLGRRYLIVLDNILSKQAWIDFRQCFPYDMNNGSCILLTTSHFKREYYPSDYIHHMTLLDSKESWGLFCNILPIKKHMVPKFEKIKNHVVEKCDGLPQLIVEVAKRLSKCNNIEEGWKKIEKELESLGILDRNALFVSYNPLPHPLKVIFLYFGVFPKRYKILVKMLIRLWIAEGFVKPTEHKELEDQAYGYLQELIDRSLLLIENQSSDGKTKTCRMHSALHSFCVWEAHKHGILCAINIQQHLGLPLKAFANSCRWLSFYSHSFDYYVLFSTNISRSHFFFQENPEMFVPPKLLRVLTFDLSYEFLRRVLVHVKDLVFLRYLSITQWFEGLDHIAANNPNLLTLVVSSNESQSGAPTVHLPSSVWEAPRLRHLELGNTYLVDPPSMVKGNLQSLSCVVTPIHCRKEVYLKLPNIKKLKIFVKDDIEASHTCGSYNNPIFLDDLDYLEKLEKLTVTVSVGRAVTLTERSMFPSQLKKLSLSGTNLSERDLMVIAKLPKLMVLKLKNALHGTVWKLPMGGFTSLKFLLLEDIKLKQWEWVIYDDDKQWEWETCDVDNFPVLEHLVLRFCNHLEKIPLIFAGVYTLQSIVLEECCSSVVASARWILKHRNYRLKLKILGTVYDESQSTDTDEPLDKILLQSIQNILIDGI